MTCLTNLMAKKKEMFAMTSQIDNVLAISGTTLQAKRRIVSDFNTDLFYVFGYELQQKPWLTYEEMYVK